MRRELDYTDVQVSCGDALEVLRRMPDARVQCIVTSPPFYGLRDYGVDGQIGLEETPEAWVAKLVEVFREARRVLRDDGVMWLEVGDSYCNSPGNGRGGYTGLSGGDPVRSGMDTSGLANVKPKDLIGTPWMLAFALRADGWYLRSETIWARPNPMPESVTDRPTKAHSQVFLLAKSPRYFYDADAIREEYSPDDRMQRNIAATAGANGHENYANRPGKPRWTNTGRNARSVWSIPPEPTPFAHFATFPQELVERCIAAGTSEHGECGDCGAPYRRVVEATGGTIGKGWHDHSDDAERGQMQRTDGPAEYATYERRFVGWEPTCACGGVFGMPDAYELIMSPTGARSEPDPSLVVGRAGMARPRGEGEGRRPMTRYEQRMYAAQIRELPLPVREEFARAAGTAFDHYVRGDRAGARAIPADLLEGWIDAGFLRRVEVPTRNLPERRPQTVLDPFMGSGTTALVARKMGRRALGIELNPDYLTIIADRLQQLSLLA